MVRRELIRRCAPAVVALAALGVGIGCNAILGIEDRPRRPDDAGIGGPDGAKDDAGDASASGDAGPRPDAAGACGAQPPPDAGATRAFCDDFDQGDITNRWDDLTLGAGPVDFDGADSVSSPRSLRVTLVSGSGSRTSTVTKTVTTTKQDVTVGFDLRLDGPSSTNFGVIEYASVELQPPPSGVAGHSVSLFQFGPGDPQIGYHQTAPDHDDTSALTPALAIGSWQRVTMRFTFGATPEFFFAINGTVAGAIPIARVTLTGVVVHLGVDTAEANTTATLHYDDVTVDEQ